MDICIDKEQDKVAKKKERGEELPQSNVNSPLTLDSSQHSMRYIYHDSL